ncbi:MAG: hypothetical protein KF716_21115 [Anaerolineae bacterium]|nr:hypothetical protein [Anaerolineae bacterium]
MPTTLPLRPPIVVCHMAAWDARFPPNSLEAIRACLIANVAFIEIDITALASEDYLLVHDPVLESETDGHGLVAATTPDQARTLHIKHRDQPTDHPVPLLSQVVDLFLHYPGRTRLQCDFKNIYPFPAEEPYARLINLLAPLGDRVIVSSGADWQLRRLRRLDSSLDLGFDIGNNLDWRALDELADPRVPPWKFGAYGYFDDHPVAGFRFTSAREYLLERCDLFANSVRGLSTFYIDHKLLMHSLKDDDFNWAEALHGFGIKLDAWTLDTTNALAVTNARLLLDAGVDQFTTNTPVELAALLQQA